MKLHQTPLTVSPNQNTTHLEQPNSLVTGKPYSSRKIQVNSKTRTEVSSTVKPPEFITEPPEFITEPRNAQLPTPAKSTTHSTSEPPSAHPCSPETTSTSQQPITASIAAFQPLPGQLPPAIALTYYRKEKRTK